MNQTGAYNLTYAPIAEISPLYIMSKSVSATGLVVDTSLSSSICPWPICLLLLRLPYEKIGFFFLIALAPVVAYGL